MNKRRTSASHRFWHRPSRVQERKSDADLAAITTAAIAVPIAVPIAVAVAVPIAIAVPVPIAVSTAAAATGPAPTCSAARAGVADGAYRRVKIFIKSRQFGPNGSEHDHQKHGDEG